MNCFGNCCSAVGFQKDGELIYRTAPISVCKVALFPVRNTPRAV